MTKRIFVFLLVVGLSLCLFPLASAFGYGFAEKTYDVDVYVGYFGTTYVKIANVTEDEMREMECGEWTYSSIDRGGYTRYNLAYGVTLESLLSNLNIATSDVDEIYFLGTDNDYWAGFYNMFGRPHYYFPYLAENYNQENPDASNIAVITSKYEEVPAILAFQQSLYRDTEAFDYDKYKSMMDDDECLRIVFGQTEWNEVSTFDSVKWVYEIAVSLKGSPITTSNWDAEIGSSQALEGYYQVNSGFSELDEKIKSGVKVTSDNPSVVQVDANNNLIAVGKGMARINIEYTDDEYGNTGAFSEQIVVTVTGDADPVPENPGSGDTDDPVPDGPNDDPNYDPDPEPDAEPEPEDEPNPVPGDPDKETPNTDGQDDEDDPDLVPDEEDEPTPDDEDDQELDEEDEPEPDDEDEPETDDDNDSRGDGDAAGFEGDEDDGSNGSSEGDGSGDSTLTQGADLEPGLEDSSAPSTGSFNKEGGTEAGEESGSGHQASDGAGDADRISSGMANGEELVPLSGEGEAVYNEVKGYMADQLGEMENVPSTEQITDITEDVRRYIEELVEQMEEEDVPVDFDEIVEMVEEYIDELVEETESEEISEDNTADDSEAAKAVYLSLGNVTGGDSTGGNVAGGSMSTGNTAGGSGGKVLEIELQPFYYTVILIAAAAALFVGGGLYRILRFRREIAVR